MWHWLLGVHWEVMWVSRLVGVLLVGVHRELCRVGMCGKPWDSLVEAQSLAVCMHVERWEATLGLEAGWHYGGDGLAVRNCKLQMMEVVVLSS